MNKVLKTGESICVGQNNISANGVMLDSIMTEGYATYMTGQITKKSKDIPFNFDADASHSVGEFDGMVSSADMIPIIKENTSDTVFEEFAKLLSNNQARFNQ